jgi:hypothetical protein
MPQQSTFQAIISAEIAISEQIRALRVTDGDNEADLYRLYDARQKLAQARKIVERVNL